MPDGGMRSKQESAGGPWVYSSGPVYDGRGSPPYPDNDNVILHTEEDVEAAIRYTKENGFLWMKTYPSIEPELYRYLLRRCRQENLPVCGHMTKKDGSQRAGGSGLYLLRAHQFPAKRTRKRSATWQKTVCWFCPQPRWCCENPAGLCVERQKAFRSGSL